MRPRPHSIRYQHSGCRLGIRARIVGGAGFFSGCLTVGRPVFKDLRKKLTKFFAEQLGGGVRVWSSRWSMIAVNVRISDEEERVEGAKTDL